MAQKRKPIRTLSDVPVELLPHRQHHTWEISHSLIYGEGKKKLDNVIGYTERRECGCGCWVEQDYDIRTAAPLGNGRRHTPKPYQTHGQGYVSRQDARQEWLARIGGVRGLSRRSRPPASCSVSDRHRGPGPTWPGNRRTSTRSAVVSPYICVPCADGLHDLCEDHDCTCDEDEHPERPS